MSELERQTEESVEDQTAPIEVDVYGVKIQAHPRAPAEANEPITLASLWESTKQSLLRICRDSLGLVADLFTSTRGVVRTAGGVPPGKVRQAHELAERREAESQEKADELIADAGALQRAEEELGYILAAHNAKGLCVQVSRTPSGTVILSIVRPEHEETAKELASQAIEEVKGLTATRLEDTQLSKRTVDALRGHGIETVFQLATAIEHLPSHVDEDVLAELHSFLASPNSSVDVAILDRPLADLDLTVKAREFMVRLGLTTIGELVSKTPDELLEEKNIGVSVVNEIQDKLEKHGLSLASTKVVTGEIHLVLPSLSGDEDT